MKPSQLYISILAVTSIALAGTIQAQSSTSKDRTPGAATSATAAGISRISSDSLKIRLTAKDLIGAAVYDLAGEKIGDIADIDLEGTVPATLASSYNAQNAGEAASVPAMDRNPDRTSSTEMTKQSSIFLSVGGLWGIGDDMVRVPASQLTYNLAEERFELMASKADVVALAEQKEPGYASDSPISETAAGKQTFSDEAVRVQDALHSDPATSAFAYKVTVTNDGEQLELHGMVDNKEQKKQLLEAARRATALDVADKLDVR